jgi:phosphonoacetate hydrolase
MLRQRIVIGMLDGFGLPYYDATPLPTLRQMASDGLFQRAQCVFPSVTNVNNVSIATGSWPCEHRITANSYYDAEAGVARYMNAGALIGARTIFRWARERGICTALLTAKRKSVELFQKEVDLAVTAEAPPNDFVERFGAPAGIYSREINYWLWRVAASLLRSEPGIGLLYVHTTDYPMHRWAPEQQESMEHLVEIDGWIDACRDAAPDAAFFITADHGMNAKTRCWDLARVCEEAGLPVRFVLSPERDYYIAHHKNYTGCAWLWLQDPGSMASVRQLLEKLEGVDAVLDREECARRFHTLPERLGDLNVMGDRTTMFGATEAALETLPPDYRAHGSLHEMDVPVLIYNFSGDLPHASYFQANKDLTSFLLRDRESR